MENHFPLVHFLMHIFIRSILYDTFGKYNLRQRHTITDKFYFVKVISCATSLIELKYQKN